MRSLKWPLEVLIVLLRISPTPDVDDAASNSRRCELSLSWAWRAFA